MVVTLFNECVTNETPLMKDIDMKNSERKNRFLMILYTLGIAGFLGMTLAACNTVSGVGRDIESAGDAIADTADDAKD
jgi:entericidin B